MLDAIKFPDELIARHDNIEAAAAMSSERKLFDLRRNARTGQRSQLRERVGQLREEIGGLTSQQTSKGKEIVLIERELVGVRDLFQKNLIQINRLTQLEREGTRLDGERGQLIASVAQSKGKIAELELQILQIDQDLSSEVAKELRDVDGKIGEFVERKITAEDQLKRIDIRAPQDGTVFQSNVHTVGGVITAGDAIMMVVPERRQSHRRSEGQSAGHRPAPRRPESASALHHLQPTHHAGNLWGGHAHFGRHYNRSAQRGELLHRAHRHERGRNRPARRSAPRSRHAGRSLRTDG